ncbi:hypothetical protein FHT80_001088 [Rhizobium sp. BK226]|nr:hypothetical protein [Rhizobium sp. BK591]MBB4111772.1 hypothetical protein [Rhizobium sp. BK226]
MWRIQTLRPRLRNEMEDADERYAENRHNIDNFYYLLGMLDLQRI